MYICKNNNTMCDTKKNILTHEQINEVIESLQGTCMWSSLDDKINELFGTDGADSYDNEEEILSKVDDNIFCCVCCGWWCEISENSDKEFDEMVCTDCEDDY